MKILHKVGRKIVAALNRPCRLGNINNMTLTDPAELFTMPKHNLIEGEKVDRAAVSVAACQFVDFIT